MLTENDKKFAKSLRDVGPYLGLGLSLAATIIVFVFIGDYLDKQNETNYYIWIFAFSGIGIGLYNFIYTVLKLEKIAEKRKKDEQGK